ncbi:hypothetical protein ACFL2Q_00985 [Thermodesulfobacteriota bacterium]
MKRYLKYRAGSRVLDLIRGEGLDPQRIKVFAGPAGGPKWFVSVGFDKALIRCGFLQKKPNRVFLAGSSAGAWRNIAMSCKDPMSAYELLRLGYSRNVFSRKDTPATVTAAFKRTMEGFIADSDIPSIMDHPFFDLGIHTVRAKGPAGSENRSIEAASLLFSALLNVVSHRTMNILYERVFFHAGTLDPRLIVPRLQGKIAKITTRNIRDVALATGSLPYIMSAVGKIADAPSGRFNDGGLLDYQLNQAYDPGPDGITLFFHYQKRIVPGWFDKRLKWRMPPAGALDRLLQVYPSPEFMELLPDRRLPDRNDFITFVDDPSERIRRWDEVSEKSEIIGEQFMDDVESGRIKGLVEPL